MARTLLLPTLSFFLHINIILIGCQAKEESNEELYHRTVQSWESSPGNFEPWNEYISDLLSRWDRSSPSPTNKKTINTKSRLPLVGGFEEGILAIEKATVARGEGTNVPRDQTLSKLYAAYGKSLMELDAQECHQLASDPHTLLIGIESLLEEGSTYLCTENAENALRNAATLDATNAMAEKLLHKLLGQDGSDSASSSSSSVHERKPKEFVAELFDSFADTFDEKLVKGLGYVVPKLVGEAAADVMTMAPQVAGGDYHPGYYRAVLDAGCGTGLAGRYLKPLLASTDEEEGGGVMVGVDASQKMLDIAAKCTTRKGCGLEEEDKEEEDNTIEEALYNDLLVLDLEDMELENTLGKVIHPESNIRGFDLIVAADVLVYFGSLTNLLQRFAMLSTKGAALIFSTERATDEEAPLGWRLLASGRFAHTKMHAMQAALSAGYQMVSYKEIVPRMERGEEVKGHLFTFILNAKPGRDEL